MQCVCAPSLPPRRAIMHRYAPRSAEVQGVAPAGCGWAGAPSRCRSHARGKRIDMGVSSTSVPLEMSELPTTIPSGGPSVPHTAMLSQARCSSKTLHTARSNSSEMASMWKRSAAFSPTSDTACMGMRACTTSWFRHRAALIGDVASRLCARTRAHQCSGRVRRICRPPPWRPYSSCGACAGPRHVTCGGTPREKPGHSLVGTTPPPPPASPLLNPQARACRGV